MFFLRGCGWSGMPRFHRRPKHDSDNKYEVIEILNKRYANGEVDSEEYKLKNEEILRRQYEKQNFNKWKSYLFRIGSHT